MGKVIDSENGILQDIEDYLNEYDKGMETAIPMDKSLSQSSVEFQLGEKRGIEKGRKLFYKDLIAVTSKLSNECKYQETSDILDKVEALSLEFSGEEISEDDPLRKCLLGTYYRDGANDLMTAIEEICTQREDIMKLHGFTIEEGKDFVNMIKTVLSLN